LPGVPDPVSALGSDNGSQSTSRDFRRHRSARGISHRRGGYRDPESQALIETWFGQCKQRCAWRSEWESIDQARTEVGAYIDSWRTRGTGRSAEARHAPADGGEADRPCRLVGGSGRSAVTDFEETPLPGLGIRYQFTTAAGMRLGVLVHRTGRRDLLVFTGDDPDECSATVPLDPEDARALADLLDESTVTVTERLGALQRVSGLAIDWIDVAADADWAGLPLGDAQVHTRTGASVVAIIHGDDVVPSPGPTHRLIPGATVVAVGTPDGLLTLAAHLRGT
jgi:TrkA domain protein